MAIRRVKTPPAKAGDGRDAASGIDSAAPLGICPMLDVDANVRRWYIRIWGTAYEGTLSNADAYHVLILARLMDTWEKRPNELSATDAKRIDSLWAKLGTNPVDRKKIAAPPGRTVEKSTTGLRDLV